MTEISLRFGLFCLPPPDQVRHALVGLAAAGERQGNTPLITMHDLDLPTYCCAHGRLIVHALVGRGRAAAAHRLCALRRALVHRHRYAQPACAICTGACTIITPFLTLHD